ncbi:codanin-1-like [Uloborus diversus]|uniref:codanin-1-like n=1 Tax=Uloborus diversus TaxID=327109 RepID=UPI00240A75D4|nr:codanin-1-like [Uloborus diversus]
MEDVLNRVIYGLLSLEELLSWLKSDLCVSEELNLANKLEFVRFFLKYVRKNTSWVLSNNVSSSAKTASRQNLNAVKSMSHSMGSQEKKCVPRFEKQPHRSGDIIIKNASATVSPPDIYSLDSFPPIECKVQRNKTKRRIAPTPAPLANKESWKFGHSGFATLTTDVPNDAFRKTPCIENSEYNFDHEREMLKLSKNRFFQSSSISRNSNVVSPVHKSVNADQNIVQFIVPDPGLISHRENVLVIVEIYNLLLLLHFVPNVTAELFFIFKLLTAKVTSLHEPSEKNMFCSIHNCIHFAVSVLNKQHGLLEILDNITLRTLSEIPFLSKFSPELVHFLRDCLFEKLDNTTNLPVSHCVPFLLENDCKNNFPDEKSFFSFKKQRDLFFELLKEWDQQSSTYTDSKFHNRFLSKAKLLVNLDSSSTNMYHLAVLFQSQLISSCLRVELDETNDTFFNEMQKNFPGKLEKLQERFVVPFRLGTFNPSPKFYGVQNFFCELIQAASSSTFNQHLLDVFLAKILDMNDADIFSDELSSTDTVKQKYISLLHSLRLLGKFLGYIVFLPYKDEKISDNDIKPDASVRKCISFPLNVPNILNASMQQQKLILTVPWVVEYLSMIEPYAKDHEEIRGTLKILALIHKSETLMPQPYNFWFLKLLIGWLFDILHYEETYQTELFTVQKSGKDNRVNSSNNKDNRENLLNSGDNRMNSLKSEDNRVTSLSNEYIRVDSLKLIDKQIIHSCCPYLVEFRVLICSFMNRVKHRHPAVKKITPVSTAKLPTATLSSKQKVQKQLVETFLFFNPALKETVEFVAEIITLKFVQKIQSEVKSLKLECFKNIVHNEKYIAVSLSDAKLRSKVIDELVDFHFSRVFSKLNLYKLFSKCCEEDISRTIPILLPDGTKPQVLEMCSQLTFQRTMNMLSEWWDAKLRFSAMKSDIHNKVYNHTEKFENVIT